MFITFNFNNNTPFINFTSKQPVENVVKKSVRLSLNKIDYDAVDIKTVKKMVKNGSSLSQIGKAIGEKMSTVRSILKHFGLNTKEGTIVSGIDKRELFELVNKGFSQKQIAKHYGIKNVAALTPLFKDLGIKVTASKVENISKFELESLLEAQMTLSEIADYYKVSPQYITARFKELGLKFPHCVSRDRVITVDEIMAGVSQGLTKNEIAHRHNVTLQKVSKLMREHNIKTRFEIENEKRTIVTLEELKEQLKTCRTKTEIARHLRVNDVYIVKLLKRYGLEIDPNLPPSKDELFTYISKIKGFKKYKTESIPALDEKRNYAEIYVRNCICNRFKINEKTLDMLLKKYELKEMLLATSKELDSEIKNLVIKKHKA